MLTTATPPGPAEGFDLDGTDESLRRLNEYSAAYGDLFRVFSPSRGAHDYVINHPDTVKHVLLSNHRNYTKGAGMDRVKLLLGNGLITSEGDFWRRQRRMIQPSFHRRVLERFDELIGEVNERYADRWAAQGARGEPVDLGEDVSELTLEITLRAIFGEDLARLTAETGDNPFDVVAKESDRDLRFAYRFRSLCRLVGQLIARRRREDAERFDFLEMLMQSRTRDGDEAMSDAELIDEVMTLIVAGHETTAASLAWTWYLLGRHPQIAEAVRAETDRAETRRPCSLAAAESLAWTHGVLQESLRLYPPGWLFTRRTIEADELGGFAVPAGTDVFICPYLLHRHPGFWERPEEFLPERFLAADAVERHRFAYIPFSVGPRHCVGENLSMFEMLVHMYTMNRRFRFTPLDRGPIEFEAQINLRPRSKLMTMVEER
ncbi:MAG: cytochrome P450 [Gammaproteobacteria bacterium]|nr:cytochrome P450 [Gammaproteobacteria bacterium]